MQPQLGIRKWLIRSLFRVDRCSLNWASGIFIILCHFVDDDPDLRTVKHTIGGDMKLLYREIEPRTTTNCNTSSKDSEIETWHTY